jgi:methyl-accepting chemotaxis protein
MLASSLVEGEDAPVATEYAVVGELLPGFLLAARKGELGPEDQRDALNQAIGTLASVSRQHIIEERTKVRARLRHVVVGITVAALLMLNAAVLLLLHTARLVLRPVDELIEASKQLGQERFDYRVQVKQHDEFDQLAEAYNRLAGQLALNEERKMVTLRQAAVALNHDLNNVLGIITLQLTKMGRQTEDNPALRQQLQLVQANLSRMAETLQSLHRLRRIVLTEYMPGQQMLDLPKSLEPDGAQGGRLAKRVNHEVRG